MLTVRKLSVSELSKLTTLFEYNSVEDMLIENKKDIEDGIIDIFGLFLNDVLIGELHTKYVCDEPLFAKPRERVYLFAFRIHKDYQGKGHGKFLLQTVIDILANEGYQEFTVGVEDDNDRAIYIYKSFGFDEIIARRQEEYQGDRYEYNLYLKR
ncbi:MAG: GNAT family N-acetyltransferase [Lachnospiraceae bacterium]|nr:GNAT family N-acetyltransferase [Lachnospiraceae bacterium]